MLPTWLSTFHLSRILKESTEFGFEPDTEGDTDVDDCGHADLQGQFVFIQTNLDWHLGLADFHIWGDGSRAGEYLMPDGQNMPGQTFAERRQENFDFTAH